MPPKKPTIQNVARLTPDEQIGYLFHQYEGFADWRIGVDKRLGEVESSNQLMAETMKGLSGKLSSMENKVEVGSQMSTQNHLLLQQVLLAVQGQRTEGLTVPGMADRMLRLEERATASEKKNEELMAKDIQHDNFKFRVYLVAGIIATTLGGLSLRFAPYLSQILALLSQ
jgi:hypothetical protein